MKKLLFTILGLGAFLSVAAEDMIPMQLERALPGKEFSGKNDIKRIIGGRNQQGILTRTGEDTYEFGYCAGIGQAFGFGEAYAGYVQEEAIEIPTYMSKGWEGMKITKMFIALGYTSNKKVNLYITKDLNGEAEMLQPATLKYDAISFDSSGQGVIEQIWNEVELDEPYTIDGNPFYVGFQTQLTSGSSYPICTDYMYSDWNLGDYVGLSIGANGEMSYMHIGELYGNLCIRFEMQGEMTAQTDALPGVLFPDDMVLQGEEFSAGFTLLNIGQQMITDMDVTYTIGGEEATDVKVDLYGQGNGGVEFGKLGYVEVSGKAPEDVLGVNLPVVFTINKLIYDDEEVDFGEMLLSQMSIVPETYPRNVVAEEFTGTWCGWCPRGMVGMEYMDENYSDQGFIGIAVHYNDQMEASSYVDMVEVFSGGSFPSAVMDRSEYFDPSVESLEQLFAAYKELPTYVKVGIKALYNEESNEITATATATLAAEQTDASYAFAFVVKENKVGPYTQTNYFAGGANGEMPGWSDRGSKVSTTYDLVARYIDSGFGINNSMPSYIEGGKDYEYSVTIPVETIVNNINDTDVEIDINNCYVVAMLLNTQTGVIMNAAQVSLEGQAGVEGIMAEPVNGLYRVYNPQGIKVLETKDATLVNSLPKGIYIINGKKVVF
ncbi:MAG: hypothetical protein J1F67_06240 [Muribaculaceae bacterium]|nr:hypothetical protein [Muribaculaceae bacterium]